MPIKIALILKYPLTILSFNFKPMTNKYSRLYTLAFLFFILLESIPCGKDRNKACESDFMGLDVNTYKDIEINNYGGFNSWRSVFILLFPDNYKIRIIGIKY